MTDKYAAQKRYMKKNLKSVKFDLNRNTDADIIEWLASQSNVRQYLIKLIREDMNKANGD